MELQTPNRNHQQASKLAFVLVNYNGIDDTIECIDSVMDCDGTATIIVVDNASTEFDSDAIKSRWHNVMIIKNESNLGWSGGNNTGIKKALSLGCEWICLLNNDTIIRRDFLQRHREITEHNPELRLYGPLIYEYDHRDEQQTAACFYNRKGHAGFMMGQAIEPNEKACEAHDTDIVNGCCVLIHRDVFESIGLIDDRFFLICEESDFCLRAEKAGFQPKILAKPLVWHKHSVSFEKAGKPLQRYYHTRNQWLLLSRHKQKSPAQRSRFATRLAYFRHAYHLFCHEIELHNHPGAKAICDGIADALVGNWGRKTRSPTRLSQSIYLALSTARFLRHGKLSSDALKTS